MSGVDAAKLLLLSVIGKSRKSLTKATQKLVQAASPNPPGDVSAAANAAIALINEYLPSATVDIYESDPGITNVVAVLNSGRPGKTLVFSGHLDTYPVGTLSQWTVPALGGSLSPDGTKLYGRGAADMKGGIAASIVAMRALAQCKDAWNGRVALALAGDEETMGDLGTSWLLDNVEAIKTADAVIIGDAGSPLVVRTGEKGLLWLEVTATGKAAHGAHVHRGVNAIEALIQAIQRIKGLEELQVPKGEIGEIIEAAKTVSKHLSGDGEAEVLRKVTMNVGTMAGGTSMNLVPNAAAAKLDIRLPYGITTARAMEYIDECLDNIKEDRRAVSYSIIRRYDSTWTSPSEKIVRCTLAAAKDMISPKATLNMRVGGSDARLYRQRGVPTVVVGLTPYNMGGPDEYCDVAELSQVAKLHAVAAFDFLKTE